jgi:hypothetical protein
MADPSGHPQTQTRLPARSDSVHQRGAFEASTTRPPAAITAASRASTGSAQSIVEEPGQ